MYRILGGAKVLRKHRMEIDISRNLFFFFWKHNVSVWNNLTYLRSDALDGATNAYVVTSCYKERFFELLLCWRNFQFCRTKICVTSSNPKTYFRRRQMCQGLLCRDYKYHNPRHHLRVRNWPKTTIVSIKHTTWTVKVAPWFNFGRPTDWDTRARFWMRISMKL